MNARPFGHATEDYKGSRPGREASAPCTLSQQARAQPPTAHILSHNKAYSKLITVQIQNVTNGTLYVRLREPLLAGTVGRNG